MKTGGGEAGLEMIQPSREGGLTRFHWQIEFAASLPLLLLAFCMGLLSFVFIQLVPEWNLTPWHVGAIGIANAAGMGIGALLAGISIDRLGRRYTARISLLVLGVGTCLGAVGWDWVSLVAFQLIAGLGAGGITPSATVLIGEFAPARYRGRLTSLIEVFYAFGWLIAVAAAFFVIPIWGWRAVFLLGGISVFYAAIQGRLIYESPRFLLARGRSEEAHRLLEMLRTRHGIILDTSPASPVTRHRSLVAGLRDLWSGPLARRTASVWITWFVLVYTYSGIFIWTPTLLSTSLLGLARTFEFSFVFTLVQIPAVLFGVFLVDWMGRKWLIVSTLLVCSVASFLFGRSTSYSELVLWGSLVSASNIMGWAVMLAYTPELFPTRIRGTGFGWASAFGRLGGLIVPGAIAMLVRTWTTGHESVFYMFAGILLVGTLLVALLAEETKGRTLEEISARGSSELPASWGHQVDPSIN